MIEFINEKKQRIDYAIKQNIKNLSWKDIYNLFKENKIYINNKLCTKKSTIVDENQQIKIDYKNNNLSKISNNIKNKLNIVYEDTYLIIVDKPTNICTYNKKKENSLIDILENQKKTKFYIVHRLDKNTSGLIIFAKNLQSQQDIQNLFKERKICKKYFALCVSNNPQKEGYIEANLKNIYKKKQVKISYETKSKYALTYFNLLKSKKNIHLYDIQIFTGRTHQIRVHMSSIGLPILGDDIYGDKKINNKYKIHIQQLQSYHLSFDLYNKHYDFTIPCKFYEYIL